MLQLPGYALKPHWQDLAPGLVLPALPALSLKFLVQDMSQSTRLRLPCAQSHSPTVPKTGHLYGQKGTQKPFLTLPPLAHPLSKTLWQTQSLEQLFKSPCSDAGDTVMVRHQTVITHYTGEWCPGKDPEGQCPVGLAELTGGRVLCREEQASTISLCGSGRR